MKYYRIKIQRIFPNEDRVLGHANGEYVVNGREYFDRIGNGEIIEDMPIFDYFHLQSFGEEKDWEWRLQDVHGFMGTGSIMGGWYISDDFKLLLENFTIAPKYHFYETRLLYKGDKLKYWIFQYGIEPFANYNLSNSVFSIKNNTIKIQSETEYCEKKREARKKYQSVLKIEKLSIKNSYDFLFNIINADRIVSKKLKLAIETMGLKGFDFSELDYEVIVEK